MMPTVRRDELNSDDIVAEVGVVRMRKQLDHGGRGAAGSQCDGKKRHDSYSEAHAFAQHYSGLNTYRCGHCNGWHNGNRNGK